MSGGNEEKASMATVKRIIRRNIKKWPEHGEHGINIYPMMDMMTILLVFMVMQFASSSAAAITQSEELRIPYSTSTMELEEAIPVQISRSAVIVDGEAIVELRNGQVDPSDKQGGGTGFLILPLHRHLDRVVELQKRISESQRRQFEGNVLIIADGRTPFRTLSEVIYTLGQAELKNLRFVTNKGASAPGASSRSSGGGGGE